MIVKAQRPRTFVVGSSTSTPPKSIVIISSKDRTPQPLSTTFVAGFWDEDLMFTMFPDSVYKAQIVANSDPTACVVVQGAAVSATTVERQVARIFPRAALPHGDNSFLLGFPSVEDLQRVDGLELCVPGQAAKLVISQWKPEEIPHRWSCTSFGSM